MNLHAKRIYKDTLKTIVRLSSIDLCVFKLIETRLYSAANLTVRVSVLRYIQSQIKLTVPLKYFGELDQFADSHIDTIQVCVCDYTCFADGYSICKWNIQNRLLYTKLMCIRQIFLIQMKYRLQSMYNHMVGRTASVISPFYSVLLECSTSYNLAGSMWFA